MTNKGRVTGRRPRAWPPAGRAMAAVVAAAVLALLAAACSGGTLPKTSPQRLGVSDTEFPTAQRACQHLLPATGGTLSAQSLQQCYLAGVCPQSLVQRAMSAGLKFSRCMRSRGVPRWPDPSLDSRGLPQFKITVPRPPPPQVSSAINECERLQPAGSQLAWG